MCVDRATATARSWLTALCPWKLTSHVTPSCLHSTSSWPLTVSMYWSSNAVIVGVGDVFVTKMYFPAMGDYEMHNRIVVFEVNRCIASEPGNPELATNGSRWRFDLSPDGPDATMVTETYDCTDSPESVREAVDNGHAWEAAMTRTLERLDELCGSS